MACGTKNAKEQLQEVEEVTDACGGRQRALLLVEYSCYLCSVFLVLCIFIAYMAASGHCFEV